MEQSVTRGDEYGTEAPPVAGGGPEAEGRGSQGLCKLEMQMPCEGSGDLREAQHFSLCINWWLRKGGKKVFFSSLRAGPWLGVKIKLTKINRRKPYVFY